MKTYKLKGLDQYIVNVPNIECAVLVCLSKRIGVTIDDLEETDHAIPLNFTQCLMDQESMKLSKVMFN